jgi:predicted HicB family RNase H-like nuclease
MKVEAIHAIVNITQHNSYHMPPKRNEKTETLNIRIDQALKRAAEAAAKDDRRTLTSLVEKALEEHLRAQGYVERSRTGSASKRKDVV